MFPGMKPGSVFLIGPMGVGKSTIGRHLAGLLRKTFLDSDHEIEARTGVSIPVIFEIEGEAGFRKRESAMIEELTAKQDVVLATGGGAVLADANRTVLRGRGLVVYLSAPIETLFERTRRDKNRPLLQTADPRQRLMDMLTQRDPLYRSIAHLIVSTEQRSPAQVARDIEQRLQDYV